MLLLKSFIICVEMIFLKKVFQLNSQQYYFDSKKYTFSLNEYEEDTQIDSHEKDDEHTIQKVVINISNSCNLRCIYCYADGGNYGSTQQLMSKNTVNLIINTLKNKGITHINRLILFGGEPFLNIKIFDYIVKKFKEVFFVNRIETVTNGTILMKK